MPNHPNLRFSITPNLLKAYLFYNLYIFDPFGPPLQLRLPQHVQIVQIQTHETWIRLEEEHFQWGKKNHVEFGKPTGKHSGPTMTNLKA